MSYERENRIADYRQAQPAEELLRKAQKSRRKAGETQEQKDVRAQRALRRVPGWCGDISGGPWGPLDAP